MEAEFAAEFVKEWEAAWNSHDLDRVLSHYSEDVVFQSPYVVQRLGEPSGEVRGKEALRAYWSSVLQAQPTLHFTLEDMRLSVDTLVINYDQATNAPNLTGLLVCATKGSSATFYLGQNLVSNTCDTVGGTSIGKLTGGTYSASADGAWAATYVWSNGNKTLTITIGAETFGTKIPTGMAGTWTFTPSQSPELLQPIVKSADATIFPCNLNHSANEGIPPGSTQTNVCLPTTATTL